MQFRSTARGPQCIFARWGSLADRVDISAGWKNVEFCAIATRSPAHRIAFNPKEISSVEITLSIINGIINGIACDDVVSTYLTIRKLLENLSSENYCRNSWRLPVIDLIGSNRYQRRRCAIGVGWLTPSPTTSRAALALSDSIPIRTTVGVVLISSLSDSVCFCSTVRSTLLFYIILHCYLIIMIFITVCSATNFRILRPFRAP